MNAFETILGVAIQREIDAYALYTTAADAAEIPSARQMLRDLAAQEMGHREKLESLLAGGLFKVLSTEQDRKIEDLKITDHLVKVPLAPDSDLQEILIVAGKREAASHDLYTSLAKVAEDSESVKLFRHLAQEELVHKRRVEALYDDLVYAEN